MFIHGAASRGGVLCMQRRYCADAHAFARLEATKGLNMSTTTVDSSAGLMQALKSAQSGDTILLAAGTYSGLSIKGIDTGGLVTIKSADESNQAVLTNFNISNSSGLKFANLEFSNADQDAYFSWIVTGSKNIQFDSLNVHGSVDGNPQNDDQGFQISDSSFISITNSEFHELYRGIAQSESNNITISGNEFHDLARTAIYSQNVQKVVIANNSFTDFYPVEGDHMDAIAFTRKGKDGVPEDNTTSDVVISGNVISRGDGLVTQGIFFRDASDGTSEFKNIQILDNIIVGMGYNGIYVRNADNVKVAGNEVLSYEGKANVSWILLQNTTGATVTQNEASVISPLEKNGNVDFVESDNTIVTAVTDGGIAALKAWLAEHGLNLEIPTWGGEYPPVVVAPPEVPSEPAAPSRPDPVEPAPNPVVDGIQSFGTSRDDHLQGTSGNDTIDGRGGADLLLGGAGDDTYVLPNSSATVVEEANGGVDTVIAKGNSILAANVENLVVSESANNNGWSGTGNELANQITGNAGNNLLSGLDGNDTINGGVGGNDTLVGGRGDDVLIGGTGKDTFRFAPGDGHDVIKDFSAGDAIDIYAYLKGGLAPSIQDVGDDVVLSFANGDSITLMGVDPSILKAAYYGFVS